MHDSEYMDKNKTDQEGAFCPIEEVYAVVCSLTPGNMRVINTINLQVHSTWRLFSEARRVAHDLNRRLNREKNKAAKNK